MGLSNKKTAKSTSTSTESASTQRTNPAWVTDALSGYTGKVGGLLDDNPLDYVAPVSGLQTQAGEAAAGLGGWKAGLETAGMPTSSVSGSSLLTGLNDYFSPYKNKVVDATLADFDVDAGRMRAAQAAGAARNSAFGGSRYGVREAQTEGELARGRATAEATLLDEGFNTAAGLSNQDAGRRQQADLANQAAEQADRARKIEIANLRGAGERADIDMQMGVGGALRAVDTEQRKAPLGLLGAVGDLLQGGQFGLFNGAESTGTTNSSGTQTAPGQGLLGTIGSLIGLGSSGLDLASKWKGF